MAGVAASQKDAGELRTDGRSAIGVWWRRMVADQALEKVWSIIRARQYELESLIDDAKRAEIEPGDLGRRLDRATQLVVEALPADRAAANELLDKLDSILPLVADDDRLRLMLEAELEHDETVLTAAARKRAHDLLGTSEGGIEHRRQLESLVTAAIRERNDRIREERITGELRQNYLTWLGSVLLLLVIGVAGFSILAAHAGIWADVVLALLSGALGGTLSGVLRLRVPESRLAALKSLGPVMLVQPLVGAVGGIVLFAIWRSGLLTVAGLDKDEWSSVTVVAFVGGFSERFFLRSLARITGAPDQSRSPHPTTDAVGRATRQASAAD
jgi:hypothetical protein